MTVGYPINKAVIDSRVGYLVKTLHDIFEGVEKMKGVLDALTTEDLTTMGYTEAEVAVLKSGITDVNSLSQVAHGLATQSPANNFFFWADKLTGVE